MKIDKEVLSRAITEKEASEFVESHPEVKAWIRKKGMKTTHNYVRNLMRYLEILEKNGIAKEPTDLYNLAKEDNDYGTKHVEVLEEFQEDCEDVQGVEGRIFNISVSVKSFYSFKGKNYQFPKSRGNYEYKNKKTKHLPKLEDVVPYIDSIPYLRNKTIVAMETCFPVRLESLTFLKWKHFKEVLENKELPHVFLISGEMKGKGQGLYAGINQHSFLTPFAKDYVLRWKAEYEVLTGKKIDLSNPQSLEEPFLISLKGKGKGEQLSYGALNNCFDRLKTEKYPFTLHVWRTFVNTALEDAGIEKKYRDIIIGHKPEDAVEDAYSDKSIERLGTFFRGAIKFLDPTYKIDENAKKVQSWLKEFKHIEVNEQEARELVDKVLLKFLGSKE
jgi:hypothetical protein